MNVGNRILVAGAGGFIGGHLVADLHRRFPGQVRAVDIKPISLWHQSISTVENLELDLSDRDACLAAAADTSTIYNLAADMGGMGFIESNKALCMLSVLINTHLLLAARERGTRAYFYASSACVYRADKQATADVVPLKESDAYPAMPEDGYGWEKLFSERMCRHFMEDFGLSVRIARFHNVYGAHGTWRGGREKAPAAICRKVIEAQTSGNGSISIWGDGTQTRSFTYIEDCIMGIRKLMESDYSDPLNIGSSELVSINELVDIVESISGLKLRRHYKTDAPMGVQGRNSDNTLVRSVLKWAPSVSLHDGLKGTYAWIQRQIASL